MDEFDEASSKRPDESPNVSKLMQKLKTVVQITENYHELQEKTKSLYVRRENFEFGIQQSRKNSDFVIEKSANLQKYTEKLNNFSNKAHLLPRFNGFIQKFGYETNIFIHSAPFDYLVPAKIETYESEGQLAPQSCR